MDLREEVLYKIFLDTHKSYDALDRDLYLKILTMYVVVPKALRLLRHYWSILKIVERASGYFGTPFKGYHRVTQGDPLYPTISNVVLYAVL